MKSMIKMKTASVGSRGQVVIPHDFRKDLKIDEKTILVLIEKGNEIIVKKSEELISKLDEKNNLRMSTLSEKSLKKVWDNKKDEVWAKYL